MKILLYTILMMLFYAGDFPLFMEWISCLWSHDVLLTANFVLFWNDANIIDYWSIKWSQWRAAIWISTDSCRNREHVPLVLMALYWSYHWFEEHRYDCFFFSPVKRSSCCVFFFFKPFSSWSCKGSFVHLHVYSICFGLKVPEHVRLLKEDPLW